MPQPVKALIVEDDAAMAAGLVRGLKAAGFEVELAVTGTDAIRVLLERAFDVVVLDLNLPGANGLEVMQRVKHLHATPVLVVSARTTLEDRLASFQAGAADYLPKPFWMEELVARLTRLTRSTAVTLRQTVRFAALELDLEARTARLHGELLNLTPNEWSILSYLASRPGKAVARTALAQQALITADEPDTRTIDSHVARLRKKLGSEAALVATVWGIGYRFDVPAGES